MSKIRQYLATSIATIGSFGLGTVLGWTASAFPQLEINKSNFTNETYTIEKKSLEFTDEELSWIGSIAIFGALLAVLSTGFLAEKFGRKFSILLFAIPFCASYIFLGFSSNGWMLFIGRFLTGFCGGAYSLVLPMYLSEISDEDIRGILTSAFHLMMCIGILFSYVVGSLVSWPLLSYICAIPPFLLLFLMIPIPESPRFYIKNGKLDKAKASLDWLQGHKKPSEEIKEEIERIKTSMTETDEISYLTLIQKPEFRRPFIISIFVLLSERLTAFDAVIFYSTDIFADAGLKESAALQSIVVGTLQVIVVFAAEFFIDRIGRRKILICTHSLIIISLLMLGGYFTMKNKLESEKLLSFSWLPLTSLTLFIVAFSIGIGPLSWTLLGELLPTCAKRKGSSIALALMWFSSFLVTKLFNNLINWLGLDWTFYLFVFIATMALIYFIFGVPETRGKNLEEIQNIFQNKNSTKM